MTKTDNAMTTAAELLAERRKFEGWLAALDSRRSTTPEHVFQRVHADYEARLEAVVAELKTKADALDARVAELTEQASKLAADVQAVKDERAESELRAHVGELAEGAWEKAAREADDRIASLGAERTAVDEELAGIREILDAARRPTPAEAAAAVAQDAPALEVMAPLADEPVAVADEPIIMADAPPAEAADGGDHADGPDHMEAAEPPLPQSEDAAGGDAPIVADEPKPARNTGGFDELAFLRDVTGVTPGKPMGLFDAADAPPAPRPSGERPLDDSLGLVLPDETPAFTPPRRPSTETPMGANVTGSAPIVIQGESKQAKTLKCTDCGSLNYPTEWYCERCGAELSAL